MVVISFFFGLSFLIRKRLPCAVRGRERRLGGVPLHAIVTVGAVGYGSGAPGRKFFEDIAATPDSPSPSKCPGAEPGTQSSSSAGSANQNTMWFRSVRIPVMLLKAKASLMMASTRTDPLPAALVVKSAMY